MNTILSDLNNVNFRWTIRSVSDGNQLLPTVLFTIHHEVLIEVGMFGFIARKKNNLVLEVTHYYTVIIQLFLNVVKLGVEFIILLIAGVAKILVICHIFVSIYFNNCYWSVFLIVYFQSFTMNCPPYERGDFIIVVTN